MSREGDFIEKQKQVSGGVVRDATNVEAKESDYLQHQKQVFDKMAEHFSSGETISDDLVPVYKHMAERILSHYSPSIDDATQKDDVSKDDSPSSSSPIKILDVACGTGALWPFLADSSKVHRLDVTGVDLSSRMVESAAEHADALFEKYLFSTEQPRHTFAVVESDVLKFNSKSSTAAADFDLVVANACFGNFWDPTAVLEHLETLMKLNGSLVVTHPLGSAFVEKLHNEDPKTVKHLLPTSPQAWIDLALTHPYQLTDLIDRPKEQESSTTEQQFYLAALKKVRARALPKVMRLRGKVDTGYGRGGKKLGFPTANLPSRLFQDALQEVATGVYFGWAVLEDLEEGSISTGRNRPHKAVVNVGFSPTFEGKENPEKIVEAHLIFEKGGNPLSPPDFYGETMRLQLIGFLRPEIKFPSFPDLIAQIRQDVVDASDALDREPYIDFARDSFLDTRENLEWIGSSGGDDSASWDFQDDVRTVLQECRSSSK